jgi:hypothetical protein
MVIDIMYLDIEMTEPEKSEKPLFARTNPNFDAEASGERPSPCFGTSGTEFLNENGGAGVPLRRPASANQRSDHDPSRQRRPDLAMIGVKACRSAKTRRGGGPTSTPAG